MAGEAQGGQGRAPATLARASLGGGSLSALGRTRARAVLRRAPERGQHWRLPHGHPAAVGGGPPAPQAEPFSSLGAGGAPHPPGAAPPPPLSPLFPPSP